MISAGKTIVRCEAPDACPVVGACACDAQGAVPCRDIGEAHDRKLLLCDAMEAIADALPSVNRLRCLEVASQLLPLLRDAHRYEEEKIFPVFVASTAGDSRARAESVDRLRVEHIEDECAAQDLTEVLLRIGHGSAVENPEAVGFMLRGFFENVRRHIAFEREHVLPVVAVPEVPEGN